MNIYTQICGIILLIVILLLYTTQKKMYLNTEKAFLMVLLALTISCSTDICSIIAIVNQDVFPDILISLICKLYLVSLVFLVTSAMIYINSDIYKYTNKYKGKNFTYITFFIVVAITIMIVPVHYVSTPEGAQYSYGPATLITYGACIFLMCEILFKCLKEEDEINPERKSAVLLWMGLWLGSAILQFLVPTFLIVSFAGTIGAVVLYVKLENPERNINRQTGLFNQNAFIEFVKQQYGAEKKFAMVSVTFNHFMENKNGEKLSWEAVWRNLPIKRVLGFRKNEDEIILIFDNVEKAREWGIDFVKKLDEHSIIDNFIINHTTWFCIPDSMQLVSSDELFQFMRYITTVKFDRSEQIEAVRRIPLSFFITDEKMIIQMRKERDVEELIDDALANNRVEVYYQPIFSTSEQSFTSAEALVRIKDELGRLISPADFIPVAEKTGKIIKLGKEVFEQVCAFIKENDISRYGLKYIEVNLSMVQCEDENLADTYISIMEKHHVSPSNINLEITESASMESKERLLANMKRLIEYGVNFSLDDFGTGQSNLNYILEMPVEIVKFDRDMTKAFFGNGKARYVMDAAMHMIHGMGLKIVSEGIETEEQFNQMNTLGIAYIQGYYFSRPLQRKDFLEFIMKHNKVGFNAAMN